MLLAILFGVDSGGHSHIRRCKDFIWYPFLALLSSKDLLIKNYKFVTQGLYTILKTNN